MKLYAKCLDEYFKMLDFKTMEFRQIESIVLENPSGEKREFLVRDIKKLDPSVQKVVMEKYPKLPWEHELPIFAIELGNEIDRNDLVFERTEADEDNEPSPTVNAQIEELDSERIFVIPEAEKTWCAVGD